MLSHHTFIYGLCKLLLMDLVHGSIIYKWTSTCLQRQNKDPPKIFWSMNYPLFLKVILRSEKSVQNSCQDPFPDRLGVKEGCCFVMWAEGPCFSVVRRPTVFTNTVWCAVRFLWSSRLIIQMMLTWLCCLSDLSSLIIGASADFFSTIIEFNFFTCKKHKITAHTALRIKTKQHKKGVLQ